jgi:hypothetical protein
VNKYNPRNKREGGLYKEHKFSFEHNFFTSNKFKLHEPSGRYIEPIVYDPENKIDAAIAKKIAAHASSKGYPIKAVSTNSDLYRHLIDRRSQAPIDEHWGSTFSD